MAAAVDLRIQLHPRIAPANVQRSHTLRTIELVAGQRKQVDVVADHIHRDLADRLHGIRVEENALFMAELANRGDRIDGADLIVGVHDADKDRLVRDRLRNIVHGHQAVRLNGQIRDLIAALLQPLAGVQHGLVLGHLRDDVVALFAVHLRDALQGKVVRLCGARGEDDLLGGRTNQLCDLLASLVDALLGFPAEGVIAAGRVAENLRHVRHHRLQNARVERRGGVIVHVDGQLNALVHGRGLQKFCDGGAHTHVLPVSVLLCPANAGCNSMPARPNLLERKVLQSAC